VVGVASEPAGHDHARQRGLQRRVLGGPLEHPADEPDVDSLVVEGAAQAASTRSAPHFFTRPNSA
jgi:hypothetical protein